MVWTLSSVLIFFAVITRMPGGHSGGRDAAVENRRAIGRAAELIARGIRAVAPGVVGELCRNSSAEPSALKR